MILYKLCNHLLAKFGPLNTHMNKHRGWMWPGNLAAFVWHVHVLRAVNRLCSQPGQTSHISEGQTLQITQKIYRWVKMRVNHSQVSKPMALSGCIQPGEIWHNTFLQLLLVPIWPLCNLFLAVQLYNEHTTSGFCLKHASSGLEWEDVLAEQLWKAEAAADSTGCPLIALAFSHSQCGHSGMRMAFADWNLLIQLIKEESIWECPLLTLECFTSRKYHILSQPGSHHCWRTGDGAAGRAALCKMAEVWW